MPTANISLSEPLLDFIHRAIEEGRFNNTSEVVRAGLHLLAREEQQERIKLEHLRKLASEGFDDINRGDFEVLTQDSLAEFVESVRATKRKRR